MSLALSATQPTPTCTEQELVAAVRGGNDRAFEELYARYRARISSYVRGMVGDHARAEDISQDVFISALRRLRETDRQVAFKPWIYEIAKNACIDEFRRAKRAREVPLEPDDDDDDSGRGRPWLASGSAPEVAVDHKQSLEDLRGAFHSLSENHHKVIVMRELEGLSYGQIGERLGMTRPVVESTLFRARRRLSEEYNELVSGRRCQHVQALILAGEPKSLLKLGVRERRQLARHLAHCQPCRRTARIVGVDESLFQAPGLASKVAALLPLPWLRWRRGGRVRHAGSSASTHPFTLLAPLQSAARFAEMTMPSAGGMGRATAAAALALAGLGGGAVVLAGNSSPRPAALHSGRPLAAHITRAARVQPARAGSHSLSGDPAEMSGKAWISAIHVGTRWGAPASIAAAPATQGGGGTGSSQLSHGSSPAGGSRALGGVGAIATQPKLTKIPSGGGGPAAGTKLQLPTLSKPKLPSLPRVPSGSGAGHNPLPGVPGIALPRVPPLSKAQLPDPQKLLSH